MDNFYPPQQRWLAQKLTLCCTFLLLFFTVSFAQTTSITCPATPLELELDASGEVVLVTADFASHTLNPNHTFEALGLVDPAMVLANDLTFNCDNVDDPVNVVAVLNFLNGNGLPRARTCNQDVIIVDNIDPVISNVPMDITMDTDPGECSAEVTFAPEITADDACGIQRLRVRVFPEFGASYFITTTGGNFPQGVNQVNVIAVDVNDNRVVETFTVTVEDNELPVITCPMDIDVIAEPGNCSANVNYLNMIDTTDNCGVDRIRFVSGIRSGDPFPIGETVVTWEAIDLSGNVSLPCSFTVTVTDGVAPVINDVDEATIALDANCAFVVPNYFSNVSDNCGIKEITQEPAPGTVLTQTVGTTVDIRLTVTDFSDLETILNVSAVLVDATVPAFVNCPADIYVPLAMTTDCQVIVELPELTAIDNCGDDVSVAQTSGILSGGMFQLGANPVTFTATDINGLTSTCSFNVIVTNDILPVFDILPATDITVNADAGLCSAVVEYPEVTATGGCGAVVPALVEGLASGSVFPVGTTLVTYLVSSNDGTLSTYSFNVIVTDAEAPEIVSGPDNIIYTLDDNCDFVIPDYTAPSALIATDNCGIESITQTPAPGLIISDHDFVQEITLTVLDAAGLMAEHTFNITLADRTNPVFTSCPGTTIKVNDIGLCGANVEFIEPMAEDNCEILSVIGTHNSGDFFGIGETPVTYTATDVAGNTTTCVFVVIVVDNEDPTITCPADIRMTTEAGICTRNVTYADPVVIDNCPMPGLPVLVHGLPSGSDFPIGVSVVEYEVQDAAGNRSVCSFTVTIEDQELPIIEAIDDITYSLNNNCEFVIPNYASETAIAYSDNCDTNLKIIQTPAPGTVLANHGTTQLVTITATDDAGNVSIPQTFTITVEDDEKPIVQLSGTTDVEVNSCEATKRVFYTLDVDDNCDIDLADIKIDFAPQGLSFTALDSSATLPVTFSLDLNPDDDGILSVTYVDAGGNTGYNELMLDIDKNRGACEIIKEEIPICAGITDAGTSKEIQWLEDKISIRAYEDQVWRVLISNGLYNSTNPTDRLEAGDFLTKVMGSTDANEVATFELQTSPGVTNLYHISGEGYDLVLINQDGEMEFVSGLGIYPTLEITALEEAYCLGSTLETIVFEADEIGEFEIVEFVRIKTDGTEEAVDVIETRSEDNTFEVDIDPNALGITSGQVTENYEIKVMFTGQHTVDINDMDMTNDDDQVNGDKRPGCPVMIVAPFEVREYKLTCNDDVTVKIDNSIDCAVNVIPDMLIENHCGNNETIYDIRILDPEGKIGAITGQNTDLVRLEGVTPGEYLFIIKVPTLKDSCWGFINIEDKDRPLCTYDLIEDEDYLDPIEYSCTAADADIKFNELEAKHFSDCTGIDEVHSFVEKTAVCTGDLLPIDFTPSDGFEVCEYQKKSWFADDLTGKTSDTCFQYVFIVRPVKESIKLRTEIFAECSVGLDEDDFKPYFIDLDGVTRVTIGDGEDICKYGASKHDDPNRIPLCGTDGSIVYKEVSHWTVIDWCTSEKLFDEETQIVEVFDTVAPVLTAGRAWAQTSSFECNAVLTFDPATGTDCVGIVNWHTVAQYIDITGHNTGAFVREENDGNGITLSDVPVGAVVTVVYTATDACGNSSSVSIEHYAIDDNPPICISNDELIVGLVKTDEHDSNVHMVGAKVYPEDIDDTSYDNCYPLIYEIRKSAKHADLSDNEGWADYVEYSYLPEELVGSDCEKIEWVDLRITEDRNGNGTVDPLERSSICPSKIRLIEQNAPEFITELACKTVSCHDAPKATFDTPDFWGFCTTIDSVTVDTMFHCPRFDMGCDSDVDGAKLGVKGIYGGVLGYQKRTWTITKDTEHGHYTDSISQYIYITEVIDETFKFPFDAKVECTSEGIPEPSTLDEILTNNGCSEWVMNVTQDTFFGAEDACLTILRNYEFINWCRFDENIIDDNRQINKDCADTNNDSKLLARDGDHQVVISTSLLASQAAKFRVGQPMMTQCLEDQTFSLNDLHLLAGGYFNYTQVIKVADSEDPYLDYDANRDLKVTPTADCDLPGYVVLALNPMDDCSLDGSISDYYIQPNGEGEKFADPYGVLKLDGEQLIIEGNYPTGTHKFHVKVDDPCGNSIWVEIPFTVGLENKKPTPVAYAAFTALMDDATCQVEIWVTDLEASSFDDCSAVEMAVYVIDQNDADNVGASIFEDPLTDYSKYAADTVFNAGANTAAFWVRDAAGNTQYTLVPVYAQDNGTCGSGQENQVAVAGKIVNEDDENIDDVTVYANGTGMTSFTSIFDGFFNLASVPMNSDLTISAEKDINYMNGISTADLVALTRHVLAIKEVTSSYKLISADVTSDNKVNTRDVLELQRLILGIKSEFDNANSWRFIAKDHVFANPSSPWGFPEAIDFQSLDANAQADFIGMKIGDVTGNAKPTNLLGDDATYGTKQINILDASVAAGETTAIEFTAADFKGLTGYQFTMKLADGVAFESVVPGVLPNLSQSNFGLNRLDQGIITTSWSDVAGLDLEDGAVLFTVNVVADHASSLSNMISMTSEVTNAEAYDNDLNPYTLEVQFVKAAGSEFALMQNTPNPFDGNTTIGFELPQAGAATLKVMDISGKTLKVITGQYNKGYNQVELSAGDLNATGVLYYELTSSNASLTKKMVVIK